MIKNNFDDVYYPENLDEILFKNVDEKMVDHIRRANENYLDDTAMTFMGESITYKEMFEHIIEYAKALRKYGLEPGDCVTLAMPNIPETVYYIYACNLIGVTAYPVDPRYSFNSILECIKNSKSKLFVCEMGTYFSKIARYSDKLPVQDKVVVSPLNMFEKRFDINKKALIGRCIFDAKKIYENLKADLYGQGNKMFQNEFLSHFNGYQGRYEADYNPDIPAIIVNTSGTTGTSIKGAMHSNRVYNIYSNEASFVTDHLTRGNTYYGYIPYFSMYGSGVGMHVALSYGVVINNIPKFNGKKSLQEIIDTKSNILIGTPTIIEKLTQMYEKEDADASHVKQYIIGGDNMSPDKLKELDDKLLARGMASKMVYGYGATECMPISTFNPDSRSHLYGSTGIIYPKAFIKVINPETMEELDYNQEGEIYVHKETMMMGYLNNPEENELVLKNIDGKIYYKTGDKGYLTESGHLFLTGRYKRMMKRPDGHQVSPIPVENAINESEMVDDCAVVGITRVNGIPGVIPTAFIVLKNKDELEKTNRIENIIKTIAEETLQNISGERENALAYVIVDKLPFTNNGKVDFPKLQKNVFDKLSFFVIDDPITREYFTGFDNLNVIKIDKQNIRSLKK